MNDERSIRIAQSCARSPRRAVEELHAELDQPDAALVLFFCSNGYDRDVLAAEMARRFAGVEVVGCTTAGEIGPAGCRDSSIAGVSFAGDVCTAVAGRLDDLQSFEIPDGQAFAHDLLIKLEDRTPAFDLRNSFAFLLIDGMSVREELVAHSVQEALGGIPVIGGSAGDGLAFERTHVYANGSFHSDSAVLVIAATPLPIREFKTQHFVPTDERMVVTEADPARRIVKEINGLPAAEEYARILGVPVKELGPMHFAASPTVVLIDGGTYVRSIQKVDPDGSLTFYCAIERGVVLRMARGVDLVANLETAFAQVREQIGPPRVVLTCDCILRKLEIVQTDLVEAVAAVLRRNNAVGFNTYGEQFCGVHINQTLTGIAIGSAEENGG